MKYHVLVLFLSLR